MNAINVNRLLLLLFSMRLHQEINQLFDEFQSETQENCRSLRCRLCKYTQWMYPPQWDFIKTDCAVFQMQPITRTTEPDSHTSFELNIQRASVSRCVFEQKQSLGLQRCCYIVSWMDTFDDVAHEMYDVWFGFELFSFVLDAKRELTAKMK